MTDIDIVFNVAAGSIQKSSLSLKLESVCQLDPTRTLSVKYSENTPLVDPKDNNTMTGKKVYELKKPDDRARELASRLSIEEQVSLWFPDLITSPWSLLLSSHGDPGFGEGECPRKPIPVFQVESIGYSFVSFPSLACAHKLRHRRGGWPKMYSLVGSNGRSRFG